MDGRVFQKVLASLSLSLRNIPMRLIFGPDKKKGYRCCSSSSCNKAKKAIVTKARLANAGASSCFIICRLIQTKPMRPKQHSQFRKSNCSRQSLHSVVDRPSVLYLGLAQGQKSNRPVSHTSLRSRSCKELLSLRRRFSAELPSNGYRACRTWGTPCWSRFSPC